MKTILAIMVIATALSGCLSKADQEIEAPEKPESFMNDMPDKDRDLLLEPLEGVLDDLKESIEKDPSMFASDESLSMGDISGTLAYRLNGRDTSMVSISLGSSANLKERHAWYYDKDGNRFYSEHEILNIDFGFEEGPNHREYKFYFDERGAQLSAYAKVSFDGEPLPEKWTSVKLTKEEQRYLQSRLRRIKEELKPVDVSE